MDMSFKLWLNETENLQEGAPWALFSTIVNALGAVAGTVIGGVGGAAQGALLGIGGDPDEKNAYGNNLKYGINLKTAGPFGAMFNMIRLGVKNGLAGMRKGFLSGGNLLPDHNNDLVAQVVVVLKKFKGQVKTDPKGAAAASAQSIMQLLGKLPPAEQKAILDQAQAQVV